MSLAFKSATGRWVMTVVVLGSGMAFLDSTIVNVAVPAIGREFHASTSSLQWVLSGYLLTLASLILLGGSLGDRLGRRRVFVVGTAIFTIASLLCAIAPTIETLIGARLVQGVGGALLTPGSLAIIEATFRRQDRARAIGAWSGLTGVSTAIGPLLGGYLITAVSWRAAFLINIPFGAIVLLTARHVPETRDPDARGKLDISGATLVALALAGSTYALIEAPDRGMSTGVVIAAVGALAALVAFVETERKSANPMLPLDIFTGQFTAANLVTFVVYAALSGVFFLLVAFLQISMGYSAIAAGAASLPVTVLMLFLAGRSGELAQRIGPRLPLAVGPLIIAAGLLLMTQIEPGDGYLTSVFPAVVVFGFGLVLVVSPVTATVLAAAPERRSGIASGVNNAVSRVASLLAIAVLPVIAGLTGHRFYVPHFMTHGFHVAMLACAGLAAAGGVLAWLTIDNDVLKADAEPAADGQAPAREFSCPVAGPPLRPGPDKVADGQGPAAQDPLAAR